MTFISSAALRLRAAVGFELLEVGADLRAVDRVELVIGLAGLRGLAELRQRLPEIEQAVRRALAAGIAAIIGEQRIGGAPRVALVEQRPCR